MRRALSLTATFLFVISVSLQGAVLVLKNGDRVSGVIVKRESGIIEIENGVLGHLKVPEAQLERIEEEVPGEATAATTTAPGAKPSKVPVIQKQGDNVGTAKEEIAEAAVATGVKESSLQSAVESKKTEQTLKDWLVAVPLVGPLVDRLSDTTWVKDWNNNLTFGFNVLIGRSDSRNYNVLFTSERKKKRTQTRIEASNEYEVSNIKGVETVTRNRTKGLFRYRHDVADRWFLQSNSQYSNARAAGIMHDLRESLGVGWKVVNTKRLQADLTPSLTAQYQSINHGDTEGINFAPTIYQEVVYSLNNRVSIRQEATALFPLTSENEPTVNFLFRVETKLISSLSLNIEYNYDYDGAAAKGAEAQQTSIRTRLGVAF